MLSPPATRPATVMLAGSPAEVRDVIANPAERQPLIEQTVVRRRGIRTVFHAQGAVAEEPERANAVVRRDHDDARVFRDSPEIISGEVCGRSAEVLAVDPDQHGHGRRWTRMWSPDVERQTVFSADGVGAPWRVDHWTRRRRHGAHPACGVPTAAPLAEASSAARLRAALQRESRERRMTRPRRCPRTSPRPVVTRHASLCGGRPHATSTASDSPAEAHHHRAQEAGHGDQSG